MIKVNSRPVSRAWGFKIRHLVIIAAILLALAIMLYLFATRSDAYEEAVYFAKSNPEVARRIGAVSDVNLRFWDGFHIIYSGSGGDASFVLSVKSQKQKTPSILDVRMKRVADSWQVKAAYLSTNTEKGISITVPTGPQNVIN